MNTLRQFGDADMSLASTTIPWSPSSSTRPSSTRPKKRHCVSRRDRVEAGVILAAFAIALALFPSPQGAAASNLSWSTVQSLNVNQSLQLGAWLPLGFSHDLSDEAIYRFCVTAQGTGSMHVDPSGLINTMTLTGGAPETTCADTHDLPSGSSVRPSATISDPASDVEILDVSWQKLVAQEN